MKAIRIHEYGGLDVLKYEDAPGPAAQGGQVLVRVEAAGLNFIDIYQRTGVYKVPLPLVLGQEGAGVVTSTGAGVTGVQAGERVAWTSILGSYAEQIAIPADRVVKLPDGITTRQGAAVMLQGLTAHYLATSTYPLKAGDTCVVHAGAGGVGLLLTQIAKLRGATVITTVSTEDKAQLSREAGADHVVLYTKDDFEAAVKTITGGKLAQVVYDSVGLTTYMKSLNCLAPRGMLALFGQSSGVVPPFDPQLLAQRGSLFFTRPTLGNYTATRAELDARASDVFGWIRDGKLRVRVGREFALEDAAKAHEALAGRKTTGKVLLIP